jgi:hypothetical protein
MKVRSRVNPHARSPRLAPLGVQVATIPSLVSGGPAAAAAPPNDAQAFCAAITLPADVAGHGRAHGAAHALRAGAWHGLVRVHRDRRRAGGSRASRRPATSTPR